MPEADSGFAGVRLARAGDEAQLFDLLTLMHGESGLASKSEARVGAIVAACCARRDHHLAGVIEGPDGIEGSIGMRLGQWWYTDDWHVEEIWNFVHPEFRGARARKARHHGAITLPAHNRRLVEFAKWCAGQLGLPLIAGVLTRERLAPKVRLYQRQMPQIGALFLVTGELPHSDFIPQREFEAA
ncbi:MAG: hypothetical protein KGL35_22885 [Bradyrhizobium sp.]|nr:hypothetical protein [Bradyrhizobium sp.]